MATTLGPIQEDYERGHIYADTQRIIEDVTAQANREIRHRLTRKVYSQLAIQLLSILLMEALFYTVEPVKLFIREHDWIIGILVALWLLIIIPLYTQRKEKPINMILLAVYTVLQGCAFAMIMMRFDSAVILESLFDMMAVFVGLTLFTFNTKRDLAWLHSVLFSGVCVVVVGGIMHLIIQNNMLEFAMSAAAAFTISVFVIFDTRVIIKTMPPEEFTFATVQLHLDFLLWCCLRLRRTTSEQ